MARPRDRRVSGLTANRKEATMLQNFQDVLIRAKQARSDELKRLLALAASAISDQLQAQLGRGVDRLGAAAGAEGAQHGREVRLDRAF